MLLILIVTAFLLLSSSKNKTIKVKNGILDLTNYNIEKNGSVSLDGQWEFYWNKLLDYDDFNNNEFEEDGILVNVPDDWNDYPVEHNKPKGSGYATYRLRVKTDNQQQLMGLKILTMSTSYKIMIDDKIIAENGIAARSKDDYKSCYNPQVVIFNKDKKEFDIIVQVANYVYTRGGMWHSIILGTDEQIINVKESSNKREMLLFGGILLMTIYQISIYSLQKYNKSNFYLILALFMLLIRLSFTGEYIIADIIKSVDVSIIALIEYLSMFWGGISWAYFNYYLYPKEISNKILRIFILITLVNTAIVLLAPTYVFTGLIVYFDAISICLFIYVLNCIIRAFIRKRKGTGILIIAHILMICSAIIDMLYFNNTMRIVSGGTIPYTIFAITIIHSFIIAKIYSKSFDEVTKLSEMLIKRDKIKDEFLANTSHELRTPLHGMISLSEHLLNESNNLYDEQKENLTYVVQCGRRLSNLVNDILDYSKLKNGDIHIYQKNISLIGITQVVVEMEKYLLKDKDIRINNFIDETIQVYVDENRFIQILTNLLSNAIKFTEKGHITLDAVIKGNRVEISIEDTGAGIPSNKIDTIFRAYEQVEQNLASLGTGLGLNITKHLVELHGGKIWLESDVGKGSKFFFTVSLGTYKSNIINDNRYIKKTNSLTWKFHNKINVFNPREKDTILIVDDDYTNLQSLANILSCKNYRLIAATNGFDALKAIDKYEIDIAILDIMMEEMSGYDLCENIRKKYSLFQMPVLLLTAQINSESMVLGFEAGANDFLSKPFIIEELVARINTLINMKKSVMEAISNEAAFLQAQIKPHFIYNAINTMVSLCSINPEATSELLIEFSNYLRKSFDFNNVQKLVTLDSEIEYIKSYLEIEKARFEDRINCRYDIGDNNLNIMIPPLLLQPLVENSVKHGILKKAGQGNILISVKEEENQVRIMVEDDGVGMNQDKINEVLLTGESNQRVGLKNINKRLKHFYGNGLIIESKVGIGTKVIITIPHKYR